MNKRGVGKDKENLAVYYLREKGLDILDTNFNTRHGEIDIIARDEKYLVFAEVKYRSGNVYGSPFDAIGISKQKSIRNAAKVYMYIKGYPETSYVRFDCIGVTDYGIEWLKSAF